MQGEFEQLDHKTTVRAHVEAVDVDGTDLFSLPDGSFTVDADPKTRELRPFCRGWQSNLRRIRRFEPRRF